MTDRYHELLSSSSILPTPHTTHLLARVRTIDIAIQSRLALILTTILNLRAREAELSLPFRPLIPLSLPVLNLRSLSNTIFKSTHS
jgi:hypothetical protein